MPIQPIRHMRLFLYSLLLLLASCADPEARNRPPADTQSGQPPPVDTTAAATHSENAEGTVPEDPEVLTSASPNEGTAARPVPQPDEITRPTPSSREGGGSGIGRGSAGRPTSAVRPRRTISMPERGTTPDLVASRDTTTTVIPRTKQVDSMALSTLAYSYFDSIKEDETKYIWAKIKSNSTRAETETLLKEHIEHVMAKPPKASDTNSIKSIYIKGYRFVTITPDSSTDFDIRLLDGEARQELDMVEGNNWRWSVRLKKGATTPHSSITLRIKATNNINGLKDYIDQQVILIDVTVFKAEAAKTADVKQPGKPKSKTGLIIGAILAVLILAGIVLRKKIARVAGIKKKPQIFFSYAWGQEREQFVDQLYDSLKADGYHVIRDKVSLGYKGVISKFMTSIGKGQFIVVAISDKYLTSEFCMFELFEIFRNAKMEKEELIKRIYPVCIENLNLNSPAVIAKYLKFWEDKEQEWEQLIKNNSGSISEEQQADYTRVKRIIAYLGSLLDFLADVNFLDQEKLSADNFQQIKTAIETRIAEEDA